MYLHVPADIATPITLLTYYASENDVVHNVSTYIATYSYVHNVRIQIRCCLANL